MSACFVLAMIPNWLMHAAPWVALCLATLVLVVALRRRWKSTPLLSRCVIVSLYAHVLFATVAYTTNYVTFRSPGFGSGEREVRVKIAAVDSEADPEVPQQPIVRTPPELIEPQVQQPEAKRSEPAPAPRTKPEIAQQEPKASIPTALDSAIEAKAEIAPRYAEAVSVAKPAVIQEQPTPPRAVTKPVSLPTAPSAPDAYQLRFRERSSVLESTGGTPDTEAAVQRALQWLAANQEQDGRWSASKHGAGRGAPQQGQDRGDTGADADSGITALALLALMGAGHTHLEGEHRLSVQHGLEYLLSIQRSDGCLAGNARLFASMYCHGMATLAIAEALGLSHDQRLQPYVERAVAYTLKSQHSGGGWRYQPNDQGDMSQFGWQIMSLKSAEMAGIKIPEVAKQRGQRFLQSVSSGRQGGLASYRTKERPSRTMTAEALVCHHLLVDAPSAAARQEAATFVLQELPTSGAPNVYYWYYGTLAMRFSGGQSWERWNEALQKQLLRTQRFDAALAGSWDPDRVWGGYGGRVFQTSLSALCLEAYYRYDL